MDKGEKQKDSEFKYRLRLAGVILDGNLDIVRALTNIKGIGTRVSCSIVKKLGINPKIKLGTLSDKELENIEKALVNIHNYFPSWMVNRKRDPYTGKDIHLISPDLDMEVRADISSERKMKSYKGIRHSLGLPVRGQRTRTSFRRGATIGVVRKKRQ